MQNYLVEYVNATFPGLLVDNYMNYTSNITFLVQLTIDLIRLMASKSPGNFFPFNTLMISKILHQ